MDSISIFGVKIDNINFEEASSNIEAYLEGNRLRAIYTPNPEIVMKAREDKEYVDLLNRGDMVTADGIGIVYAGKLNKKPLKGRVTGYDMSIKMLEIANEKAYSLYLLGGKDGVTKIASENILKDYPNIKIAGYHHGYFQGPHTGDQETETSLNVIEDINSSKPDIIFVGLGFPKQEKWIDINRDKIYGKIAIGNGGVMDILAGNMTRAPEIWQKIGMEWLYRLIKEPSRIKRQVIIPKFLLEVIFRRDAVK